METTARLEGVRTGDRAILAALAAAFLSVALLYIVGFAPLPAIHNAAHDVRHASGFPCH